MAIVSKQARHLRGAIDPFDAGQAVGQRRDGIQVGTPDESIDQAKVIAAVEEAGYEARPAGA